MQHLKLARQMYMFNRKQKSPGLPGVLGCPVEDVELKILENGRESITLGHKFFGNVFGSNVHDKPRNLLELMDRISDSSAVVLNTKLFKSVNPSINVVESDECAPAKTLGQCVGRLPWIGRRVLDYLESTKPRKIKIALNLIPMQRQLSLGTTVDNMGNTAVEFGGTMPFPFGTMSSIGASASVSTATRPQFFGHLYVPLLRTVARAKQSILESYSSRLWFLSLDAQQGKEEYSACSTVLDKRNISLHFSNNQHDISTGIRLEHSIPSWTTSFTPNSSILNSLKEFATVLCEYNGGYSLRSCHTGKYSMVFGFPLAGLSRDPKCPIPFLKSSFKYSFANQFKWLGLRAQVAAGHIVPINIRGIDLLGSSSSLPNISLSHRFFLGGPHDAMFKIRGTHQHCVGGLQELRTSEDRARIPVHPHSTSLGSWISSVLQRTSANDQRRQFDYLGGTSALGGSVSLHLDLMSLFPKHEWTHRLSPFGFMDAGLLLPGLNKAVTCKSFDAMKKIGRECGGLSVGGGVRFVLSPNLGLDCTVTPLSISNGPREVLQLSIQQYSNS